MFSVCLSELVTLITPDLCGEIVTTQSFLASAIAISLFAFACDSKSVSPPLGPPIMKFTSYSAGLDRISYDAITFDSEAAYETGLLQEKIGLSPNGYSLFGR